MRVGLLIYGSLETISGGYLYDRKLVEHLRARGDQVEVISLPGRNYMRHLGDNLLINLRRRLEQLEVDVLLEDELNHPSLWWINRRLKRSYALLSIVHHLRSSEEWPSWQKPIYRRIERAYLSSVEGYVFNSCTTRETVEGLVRSNKPGVVAFPAGDRLQPCIRDEEIVQRASQPCPLKVLFLGNLIWRKGLHVLLEALALLKTGAFTLAVVGRMDADRNYTRSILRRVGRLGLAGQVTFHGALDESALIKRMRASHVLAVPSSYEGYGIVYLEGMGFGLPAIATLGGAAQEIITHGVDGYLIPPGDAHALAYYLRMLSEERGLLARLGKAARARYLAQPTWEETAARIRNFLTTFVEGG